MSCCCVGWIRFHNQRCGLWMHCIEPIWEFWESCLILVFACGCERFTQVYYHHSNNWRYLDQFPSSQICEMEAFEDWELFYVNMYKIWNGGSWCFIEGDNINCGFCNDCKIVSTCILVGNLKGYIRVLNGALVYVIVKTDWIEAIVRVNEEALLNLHG